MSAFLLLSAPALKAPRASSHSSQSTSNRSGKASSVRMAPSRTSMQSAAAAPSTVSSGSRERKYFDPDTLAYVDAHAHLSLFERKLMCFSDAVAAAKAKSVGEPLTKALNDATRSSQGLCGGGPLLTTDNLEILQYNYYEKFTPDAASIKNHLRFKPPAYLHVMLADEQVDRAIRQDEASASPRQQDPKPGPGKPRKNRPVPRTHSLNRLNQYTKMCQDMPMPQDKEWPPKPSSLAEEAIRGRVAAMQRRLTCPAAQTADYCVSVRDALHLLLFWDDVYHDMRCDTLGEDYYAWLPPRETTQRLFLALLDFALSRLRVVTCPLSAAEAGDLNADERHELARNQFFYLQKADGALVGCLLAFLRDHFLEQIAVFVVSPKMTGVHELLAVVGARMCDNLKLHFYGHSRAEAVTALFHDFLVGVLDALLQDADRPDPPPETCSLSQYSLVASVFEPVTTDAGHSAVLRVLESEPPPKTGGKRSKWGFLRRSKK
ncbi:hypothetical protein METBIDRAFT_11877 [Metschnikowia bicuspidata var. bicuspidata NRRL YB-4993]|uniref:Uncharacterized protein n=1 Tax=Metschnikowia bicuspidata var. bicuspidata NRRL YB-4993 TaxID=869754 RepID=A0A1A0HBI2_9ASCO|nr:hypothetical protein METBIDRAFT_11877 [Metschnikowia bicuspidata var. bicuspidata NRRL YB-4993]OBA21345.1 hypothetical protein METBIDRAFT_11877 [Metschnikowia bicuspidata var. bicuspidata NRRL YB-4993]